MGRPVVEWSIEAFQEHPMVSDVVVVVNEDHLVLLKAKTLTLTLSRRERGPDFLPLPPGEGRGEGLTVVTGGSTRQQSVQNGLAALRAAKPDIVLIHDAARPLISQQLITDLCNAAIESGAAIPALPVTDTIKRNGKTESRENLYTVQTPQAFNFKLIDKLHKKYQDKSMTDDAALCETDGIPVTFVPGQADNIKITHPSDLARAEQVLFSRNGDVRTGLGYDVHRLIPCTTAQPLMLCGIAVPHDHVLQGHSDADVALHAITDAVLATVCAGDIGLHFSDKDPRWKNADSAVFLKHAAALVAQQGGIITHVDVTLICEAPKISPLRADMQARIADIMQIPAARVNVKATTTEGLGFTGRREGITAQAIVTARLPFAAAAQEQQTEETRRWAS